MLFWSTKQNRPFISLCFGLYEKTRIFTLSEARFNLRKATAPHKKNRMNGATSENEYAYIKEGKVFLKGYLDMPDRQIGEVKRTEEEAFKYFEDRYDIAVSKVEQLKVEIETAQNKGSYLTKLKQLRKRLLTFDGIGNFMPLLDKLDLLEGSLSGMIDENQTNNLTIKQELLAEAQEVGKSDEWQETADTLQDIRTRWIRTGPVPKENQEEIEEAFKDTLDEFYQRRKAYFEEQRRITDERLLRYHELIKVADSLLDRRDWDEAFQDLKGIQAEWKTVGKIHPKILRDPYKRFKQLTGTFYQRYCKAKGIEIKPRVDPRIAAQQKMVADVDRLAESDDMVAAANRTKMLLNEWKNIRLPYNMVDRDLAERFRSACDKIFELSYLMKVVHRKNPTYSYMSAEQQLQAKYHEMEYIVKRAREDLEHLSASMNTIKSNPDSETDRLLFNNVRTQERKLMMKEVILEELRRKVN